MKRNFFSKKSMLLSLLLLLIFAGLSASFLVYSYSQLLKETELHMQEIAVRGADKASAAISDRFQVLDTVAQCLLLDEDISEKEKIEQLKKASDENEFLTIGYADAHGRAGTTDGKSYSVSEQSFYQEAMAGGNNISGFFVDTQEDGEPLVWVTAVPVQKDGAVLGVLFASSPAERLTDIVGLHFFGDRGYSYMLDNNGTVMTSQNPGEVDRNFYELLEQNCQNTRDRDNLERLETMLQGNSTGVARIKINGQVYFCSFAPLLTEDSINKDQLNLLCAAPEDYIFGSAKGVIVAAIAACAGLFLVFVAIILLFALQSNRHTKRLYQHAYFDTLTGIPNYAKFCEDCEVLREGAPDSQFAVVSIGLRRFKVINESFGYAFGDKVLAEVGTQLRESLEGKAVYARMMADSFAVCVQMEGDDRSAVLSILDSLKERIMQVNVLGMDVKLHMNCGIYLVQGTKVDIRTCVDDAMLTAKLHNGTNDDSYAFFDRNMQKKLEEEAQIQVDLAEAFEGGQLSVYYQPVKSFQTNEITGAEALIRWKHPKKGNLLPAQFIPIAEKSTLIYKIGRFVFEQVCMSLYEWRDYEEKFLVSVNISRMELYQDDLISFMETTLKRYHVDPSRIEIELTETAAVDDLEFLKSMVLKFKQIGLFVAIDDFGTGYSSLSCLNTIPFDVLKLDRSLIQGLDGENHGEETVRAVVDLAKSFGFTVVAEGVETKEQADFLSAIGCDIAQGFYYAYPMKKEALELFAFSGAAMKKNGIS